MEAKTTQELADKLLDYESDVLLEGHYELGDDFTFLQPKLSLYKDKKGEQMRRRKKSSSSEDEGPSSVSSSDSSDEDNENLAKRTKVNNSNGTTQLAFKASLKNPLQRIPFPAVAPPVQPSHAMVAEKNTDGISLIPQRQSSIESSAMHPVFDDEVSLLSTAPDPPIIVTRVNAHGKLMCACYWVFISN